jgi:hypothetical protein
MNILPLAAAVLPLATPALAPDGSIPRNPIPGSGFPSRSASRFQFRTLSSTQAERPPVIDEIAERGSRAAHGHTEQQTVGGLERATPRCRMRTT